MKNQVPTKKDELRELASLTLVDAVHRPDNGGRVGKQIKVLANLYPIEFSAENFRIFQYDIDVVQLRENEEDGRMYELPPSDRLLPQEILLDLFDKALDQMPEVRVIQRISLAYDGRKIAVSNREMPFFETQVDVDYNPNNALRRTRHFRVKMKCTGACNTDTVNRYIQADRRTIQSAGSAFVSNLGQVLHSFNIVFRVDALKQFVVYGAGGRRFFDKNPDPHFDQSFPGGAHIWRGFFQSVLPLQGGLFLNLDVCFSPFLMTGDLMDVAGKILNEGGRFDKHNAPNAAQLQQLRKVFRNVTIEPTKGNSRPGKFIGFTTTSARSTIFLRDGHEISISDYFSQRYNVTLLYPNWPCVMIRDRHTFVPAEYCLIISNSPITPQKMTATQVQELMRKSAQKPDERLRETNRWRKKRAYENNEKLTSWNVEVAKDPIQVSARLLPSPQVGYRDSSNINIREGSGNWNLYGNEFYQSGDSLFTPVIVNFTRANENQCLDFMRKLFDECYRLGMIIKVEYMSCYHSRNMQDPENMQEILTEAGRKAFKDSEKRKEPQIFFCFLDKNMTSIHRAIKKVTCTKLPGNAGVPSQCINITKAFNQRGQNQYCANLAMKINVKLGGCNQILSSPNDKPKVNGNTMFVGLNLRHPPAGLERESIVGVVTTLNGKGTKFGNQFSVQTNPRQGHQQEAILEGKSLFTNLLKMRMNEKDNNLPQNIVVFRDGVSQGEYMQVKDSEVLQLKQACTDFDKAYNPKITYIVATKKHRIRFYPQDRRFADNSGNLPAGTVVDNTVTHPYVFEFYLQSHSGLKGTCRPAKYTILHDEVKFSSDELQLLTNSLCYSYQRATRSISQVPIVKYAGLLAEKADFLLNANDTQDIESSNDENRNPTRNAQVNHIIEKYNRTNEVTQYSLKKVLWYV